MLVLPTYLLVVGGMLLGSILIRVYYCLLWVVGCLLDVIDWATGRARMQGARDHLKFQELHVMTDKSGDLAELRR